MFQRQDWLHVCTNKRTATDEINASTGQHRKNLLPFIPRDRCILDTLHLLLRCVHRLIHGMAVYCLRVLGPNVDKESDQAEVLNKSLAKGFAEITKKNRTSLQPPNARGSLWKINRVNGSDYRLLLKKFNLARCLELGGASTSARNNELTKRYQKAWDKFSEVFDIINAPKKQGVLRARNTINKWFKGNVNDCVERQEGGEPLQKNNPLFLASFLLTPYFHNLLNHIPDLLKHGEIHSFTGQKLRKDEQRPPQVLAALQHDGGRRDLLHNVPTSPGTYEPGPACRPCE